MKRFLRILALVMVAALLLPAVFACTPEEPVTDTTTAAPDDGTTTVAPDGGDNEPDDGTTTAEPNDATTTTAQDDGATTTATPDDPADGSTTTAEPDDDGTTTTAEPDDDGTTTTAEPDDDGTTTTAKPDDSDDDPDDTTTTAKPDDSDDDPDGTTTAKPDSGDDDPDAEDKHTIWFVDSNGAVLQELRVKEGATPAYTGDTPTKAADGQSVYEFAGWGPAIKAATSDAVYVAQFYEKRGLVLADIPSALLTSNGYLNYFSSNKCVYKIGEFDLADVSAISIEYNLSGETNYADNGAAYYLLSESVSSRITPSTDVDPDIVIAYAPVTQNSNGKYELQFDLAKTDYSGPVYLAYVQFGQARGHVSAITLVSNAAVEGGYNPGTTPGAAYTVKFVNADGTVLQESKLMSGAIPTYRGVTPEKAEDAQYGYTFSGWTPQISAVTGEIVYTAQFTATLLKPAYTIAFVDKNDALLYEVEAREDTTVPAPPANMQGVANMNATAWKDGEGNLYLWSGHVKSDSNPCWTDIAGNPIEFKVTKDMILTPCSDMIDITTIAGHDKDTSTGTPRLPNIQKAENLYDLGAWDLSKYVAVKITYGRATSVKSGTLVLIAENNQTATPVASIATVPTSANYAAGPATVIIDLSSANWEYSHLYMTVPDNANSISCYRIEFIEYAGTEQIPEIKDPATGPITDEYLNKTLTEGYEKFQYNQVTAAQGKGYVTLTSTGNVAWIAPAVSIPTAPVLAIKYRTYDSVAASVNLLAGDSADNHSFGWIGDGEWHLLTLELSDAMANEETIRALRLNLAGRSGVEVDVQYIAFFDSVKAAEEYDEEAGSPVASNDIQTMPDFKVSGVFSSHMVLQRNQPIKVWGFSNSEGSTVTGTFAGETVTAKVAADGTWMLTFAAQDANKVGQTMTISDDRDHTTTLEDILIGDVWLIGGQSNAEMNLSRCMNYLPEGFTFNENDPIRLFKQTQSYAAKQTEATLRPQLDVINPNWAWSTASEDAAKGFSAMGYIFAKEIIKEVDVPQGMIMMAAGGAMLQELYPAWIANELGYTKGGNVCVGGYYNTLIAPFEGLSFKGMLFFQGESECGASSSPLYRERMEGLIANERERFGFDFPLYYVQLSDYTNLFAYQHVVRAHQFDALKTIPNSSMVVSMDKGSPAEFGDNAHSPYKYDVGYRLALLALAKEYDIGDENYVTSPMATNAVVSEDGTKITVTFENVGDGLIAYGKTPEASIGQSVEGFSVGNGTANVQVTATIISKNTVEITVPQGVKPTSVDYGYFVGVNSTTASLYNSENLPAAAFSLKLS